MNKFQTNIQSALGRIKSKVVFITEQSMYPKRKSCINSFINVAGTRCLTMNVFDQKVKFIQLNNAFQQFQLHENQHHTEPGTYSSSKKWLRNPFTLVKIHFLSSILASKKNPTLNQDKQKGKSIQSVIGNYRKFNEKWLYKDTLRIRIFNI